MSLPSCYYRRRFCLLMIAVAALGCRKSEQIVSYTVPKEPPRATAAANGMESDQPAASAGPSTPTDRMLAAILPDGQRAWFFKVVGPMATIDKHAQQISDFFAGIRPAGNRPLPTWALPTGWTEQPGNAMRAATIVIPGEKPLELTVTSLGWQGTTEEKLNNVNRWRGQMQLPPIGPQQVADTTQQIKVGDATMTVVDLQGRFQGGMTAPFAGGPVSVDGRSSAPPGKSNGLPAGHPPVGPADGAATGRRPAVGSQANTDAALSAMPKFEVPPTWQAAPNSEFSRASLNIADGAQRARVTISEFSAGAGPMITDPLAHVNRWRDELGLAHVDKNSLGKVTQPILVDGHAAIYMPAIPDAAKSEESQADQATLAAMVPEGDRVWFFKLKGDRDLVAAERERFESFLKSVRFTADRGATDGN